jgi:hypothetical protein
LDDPGGDAVRAVLHSSTIDTKSKDIMEILPNGDPGDGLPPIVAVTVTMKSKKATVTANPFILNLRKPYELQPNGVVDKTDSTYGFQSQTGIRQIARSCNPKSATAWHKLQA